MQASTSTFSKQIMYKDISRDNNDGYCRCCLAIGHHSRMLGKAELQILRENLNVILSADPRLPQYICLSCNTSLSVVHTFKQKVLASEAQLLKIVNAVQAKQHDASSKVAPVPQNDPLSISRETPVKLEDEVHDFFIENDDYPDSSQNDLDQLEVDKVKTEGDANQDPLIQIKEPHRTIDGSKTVKVELQSAIKNADGSKTVKVELQSAIKNADEDSTRIYLSASSIKAATEKSTKKRKSSMEIQETKHRDDLTYLNIGDRVEVATDITKIRANIILILQNSTAIPFRLKTNYFQCFHCDNTFGVFKNLKQHNETDHKNGVTDYTIFDCLRSKYRKIVHADITHLKCKICHQTIENIDDLVQHLVQVHKQLYHDVRDESVKVPTHGVIGYKVDTDALKCHLCDTQFRFIKYLISHMTEHYGKFSCPDCDKKFVTNERLTEHCKTHVLTDTKCTDCHLIFSTRRLMLNHRYAKHIKKNKRTVKCSECTMTFPMTKPLLRFVHMENVHGVTRPMYNCDYCGKTYQTVHSMGHHVRTVHVKKNQFVCDKCGYVATEKNVMDRHIEHHNGVRKFECDFCHKKLRTKGNLRLHLRGHYNDKRFACSLCEAAFIQKHCLKSHIKSRHPDSGIDVNKL